MNGLTPFILVLAVAWAAPVLAGAAALNTLTPAEKAAGWQLLFDGRSLKGWRLYGKPGSGAAQIGSGWQIEDGILKKLAGQVARADQRRVVAVADGKRSRCRNAGATSSPRVRLFGCGAGLIGVGTFAGGGPA